MSEQNNTIRPYTGEALQKAVENHIRKDYCFKFEEKKFIEVEAIEPETSITLDPYFPSEELQEAVELMQIAKRPLLLQGEPGSGKTRIAQAVAYEFYRDEVDFNRYYFEWHIKSTSKARDGLYTFDHIERLRDANREGGDDKDLTKYRSLGPLGKAFLASEPGKPAILLIDEIDKADLDFPNDLLLELDQMRFNIPETGEEIAPEQRPLIFITSNQEKEMPQAFLRRCLFMYIKFPNDEILGKIMKSRFPDWDDDEKSEETTYFIQALARFKEIHQYLEENPIRSKNLSLSELKDWIDLLQHYYKKGRHDKIKLGENGANTPFLSSLIKTEKDLTIWLSSISNK